MSLCRCVYVDVCVWGCLCVGVWCSQMKEKGLDFLAGLTWSRTGQHTWDWPWWCMNWCVSAEVGFQKQSSLGKAPVLALPHALESPVAAGFPGQVRWVLRPLYLLLHLHLCRLWRDWLGTSSARYRKALCPGSPFLHSAAFLLSRGGSVCPLWWLFYLPGAPVWGCCGYVWSILGARMVIDQPPELREEVQQMNRVSRRTTCSPFPILRGVLICGRPGPPPLGISWTPCSSWDQMHGS